MRQLKSYLPSLYNDIKETDYIMAAEQPEFSDFIAENKLAFKRQSVINADEIGIKLYERILGIYSNPNETLDFRKERIILQLNSSPPFTMKYLRNSLDKIMGKGNYKTWCDYNKFELYIEGVTKNKNWFIELRYLLARVKPANLLYIYIAYDKNNIDVSQKIYAAQGTWNYKLGLWRLGEKPFYSDQAEITWNYKLGEWRLGEKTFGKDGSELITIGGIKDTLLESSARYALTLIHSLKINDILVIPKEDFIDLYIAQNTVRIEAVFPESDIKTITNIKILGLNNIALSESNNIYIVKEEALKLTIEWEYREGEKE